jgi:hypothetical protein
MATTTTTATPTGWAADAAKSNWQFAQGIANTPYNPYQGNMLAGWGPGQQTAYNSTLNGAAGAGLGAMQQAQGFATQAGGYTPPMVGIPVAATPQGQAVGTGWASAGDPTKIGVTNTQAAQAGPAAGFGVVNTGFANAGNAAGFGVSNTGFSSAGPAAQMQAANAGPAAQMQAAQMSRGDVRNVQAGSFPGANFAQYSNPYTDAVVNTTLGQLGRQNDLIQQRTNAAASKAGAYGGGRQAVANSENNRAFLDTAAQTTSNLYNQNFNQAQQAIQADQNRALTADQANQGQDWNVGQSNLANRQQSAYQNMLAGNEMSMFNAGNQQAANAANQAALNAQSQYDATNQQRGIEATAASHNKAAQAYAEQQNLMAQYNATNQQSGIEATAASHNKAAQAYAEQQNLMAQYNATNQQTANTQTADAHNTIAQQYASNADTMARYNTGNQQRGLEATAAQTNDMTQANMSAGTSANNLNAELSLRGQTANQLASQAAVNNQVQAANALNGMGLDQQQQLLTGANAQMAAGQARTGFDQAAMEQQYQQWLQAQNYPRTQLATLQQGLNGYNSGSAQTSPYYSNTGANILAGTLGAGALGAGILQNGSAIASGAGALAGMFGGGGAGASLMPNSIYDAGAMSGSSLLSSMGF